MDIIKKFGPLSENTLPLLVYQSGYRPVQEQFFPAFQLLDPEVKHFYHKNILKRIGNCILN